MFAIRNSQTLFRGIHRVNHFARLEPLFACRKSWISSSSTAHNDQQGNNNQNFVHNLTSVAVGVGAGYMLWQFLSNDQNYLGTCEAKADCGCSSRNPPLNAKSTDVLNSSCESATPPQQKSQEEYKKAKKQAKKILQLLKEEYGVPGVTVSLKRHQFFIKYWKTLLMIRDMIGCNWN